MNITINTTGNTTTFEALNKRALIRIDGEPDDLMVWIDAELYKNDDLIDSDAFKAPNTDDEIAKAKDAAILWCFKHLI